MGHLAEHFAARGLTPRRADAREFLEEFCRLCAQQLSETGVRVATRCPSRGCRSGGSSGQNCRAASLAAAAERIVG